MVLWDYLAFYMKYIGKIENNMKKIYILLTIFLVLGIWSCKTKKSTTDFKQTEITTVSTLISENKEQKSLITENEQKQETKSEIDKSFFEACMSFESDKITITDSQGNKTEIINPRVNKKSSKSNDKIKTEQTDRESNKVATNEENQQNDVKADSSKETKTDLQETSKSKGREPVWLWIVGGCTVGGLGYFVLKRFRLI